MHEHMQRYVMNAPTIRDFGSYDYFEISLEEAVEWLWQGRFTSTIRSSLQCQVMEDLTHVSIYSVRKGVKFPGLAPGDEALIFYTPTSDYYKSVQEMPYEYMRENYVLGLLKRVDVIEAEETRDTGELISGNVEQEV